MKLKKQKSSLGRDVNDKDKKRRGNKQKARKQQNDEDVPITKKKEQNHSLEAKPRKKKSSSFVEESAKSKKRNIVKLGGLHFPVKLKKKKAVLESSNLKENDAEKIGKKRKRPWRQTVRNKAKRERLILERGEEEENNGNEEENDHENEVDMSSATAKKKKKRSREKRLKNKQRLLAKIGNDAEGEEEIKENLLKKDAKSRLDASRFRYINEKLYTQPSTSAVQLFNEDPEAFKTYHRGYKEQLKKWPINPLQTIILDLSTMEKGTVIADLGCGEAELAKKLGDQFQVHSFDLVATNELTVVADMANLPLAANSVDVCVYCLSLMGTNLAHFFREAHRILKKSGKLKIAEVASRFQNVKSFVAALNRMGFQLKRRKEIGDGFFIILTLQKVGKIENKRPLGLQLLPCLYKKR